MKKIISVFLAITMLFSTAVIGASAEDATDDLVITVANDLHYNHTLKAENVADGKYTEDYANAVGTGQMKLENELIIDEFLNQAAANDSSAILLPGDITDKGSDTELVYMAAKLTAFEKATGKEVYLIPGNHDYFGGCTVEKFKAFYKELIFDQVITVDTKTASYVADINDEYRLLAIDATKPRGNQNLNEELYAWIETQFKAAETDGKKVIAMSHYNLLEHLVMMSVLHNGSILTPSLDLPELFAKYNVKYTFTGHTHDHDIEAYKGANGNTIYDVVTTSINAYPCAYRVVSFGEKVKFETKYIESVDTSSLKGKITDATYAQATEDFSAYSYNLFCEGLKTTISSYVSAAQFKKLLKLDAEKDAELCAILDTVIPKAAEVINMPLYRADETEDGKSVEAILSEYSITLPESDYDTIVDIAAMVYLTHVLGDERIGVFDTDLSLTTSCFAAIFNYALEDVTAEQYAQIMSIACSFLGTNVPVDFFKYAGSGFKKAEGVDLFIAGVLTPVLLEVTTDEGTPDNNVTLDGYAAAYEEEEELTFWEKIVKFFKAVFAYIARIFGF